MRIREVKDCVDNDANPEVLKKPWIYPYIYIYARVYLRSLSLSLSTFSLFSHSVPSGGLVAEAVLAG